MVVTMPHRKPPVEDLPRKSPAVEAQDPAVAAKDCDYDVGILRIVEGRCTKSEQRRHPKGSSCHAILSVRIENKERRAVESSTNLRSDSIQSTQERSILDTNSHTAPWVSSSTSSNMFAPTIPLPTTNLRPRFSKN